MTPDPTPPAGPPPLSPPMVLESVPADDEIVGVKLDNIITNDPARTLAALARLAAGEPGAELLTRWHMRFMAACDLGPQWQALASGPALLGLDARRYPVFIRNGILQPKQSESAHA